MYVCVLHVGCMWRGRTEPPTLSEVGFMGVHPVHGSDRVTETSKEGSMLIRTSPIDRPFFHSHEENFLSGNRANSLNLAYQVLTRTLSAYVNPLSQAALTRAAGDEKNGSMRPMRVARVQPRARGQDMVMLHSTHAIANGWPMDSHTR